MNRFLFAQERERSSVRTHVRLTMNDLCINYMASYDEREIWSGSSTHSRDHGKSHARFGGFPKKNSTARRTLEHKHIFSCHLQFCGIWWSLRIMFPSPRRSSLNLICIFKRKKSRRDYNQRLTFLLCALSQFAFVHAALTASLVYSYQMNVFTPVRGSFMQCAIAIIWHCRRREIFSLLRLRNCDIFIVSVVITFFFRFHMVNDYMHLWHLITLLFCHLMSCKAKEKMI